MKSTSEIVKELLSIGFEDVSPDKNGMAYRKRIDGGLLELCWYTTDEYLRLQSQGSGFTMSLKGIQNINQIKTFWLMITGKSL